MSADPPPSLLITPDRRRRLQQRFEQAQQLSAQPRPDFRHVHELLADCLRADPGNILYLNALFANLRKKRAATTSDSWLRRWFGRWVPSSRPAGPKADATTEFAANLSPAQSALRDAPEQLWREPANVALLRQLAEAAGDCSFDEAELVYLTVAREHAPDDPETLRMLARTLTRQGRFEDAVGPWFAVLALAPDDSEAAQATNDLRGAGGSSVKSSLPDTPQHPIPRVAEPLVAQARSLQDAGDFAAAEHCLAQAQAAAGGNLAVLHLREQLRLAQSEHRLMIARRRAASDPHAKALALVSQLAEEHNRLEIEILNIRAERLPDTVDLRVELARRLKRAGNFSGAIQRLEEVLRLHSNDPATLILLGECWQHLRQFPKALEFYERAIVRAGSLSSSDDISKLARYRAATLAAALGQRDFARNHFQALVATDPAFKDAREWLDKLQPS